MLTWILVLALIWPALWLIRVLLVTKLLLGIEFKARNVVALAPEAVPPHLAEAAQPWIAELEPLGFRLLGALRTVHADEPALDEYALVLAHAGEPLRAMIRPHESAARSGECWLELRTTAENGFEYLTASHAPEKIAPLPPGIEIEVVAGARAGELLRRHRERIAPLAAGAWRCVDLDGAATRERFLTDGVFAHLCASGLLAPRGAGAFSYRVGQALKTSVTLIRSAVKQQKLERAQRRAGTTDAAGARPLSDEAQTTFDLTHYRQMVAVTRGRLSLRAKAILTTVSFLMFAGVLAWNWSLAGAISLIVALVIHEGGHLAGMWWFGYRDTQLLFIPFFGGAAVGHDDKVLKPWQHIVIILLGPLPGLFAGLVLFVLADGSGWLHEAALTAIVLNAFNLLPILPLDGGQIVDYAVASRFPRARVGFLALSALALLGVALLLDGVVVLAVVAVLMLLRLPVEWRIAGVRRELRGEFPEGGEQEAIVRRLLERLREPEWAKVTMAQRLNLVQGLQNVLRMPRAGLGTICFAIVGYSAPLWGGAPLALWAAQRQAEAKLHRAEQSAVAAGLVLRATPAAVATTHVPAEENAAIPLAEAEALLGPGFAALRMEGPNAEKARALLSEAARRRMFAPVPPRPEAKKGLWASPFLRGRGVRHLVSIAEERMRFREPLVAAELALDALRLARLTDAAPGWLPWTTRRQLVESAWGVIEEVLAADAHLPPAMLAELHSRLDERHEIKLAAAAKPQELVQPFAAVDDLAAESGEEVDRSFRFWGWALQLGGTVARYRAESIESAINVHRALLDVQQGRWPELKGDDFDAAQLATIELADFLARLRQARAALLVAQHRERGVIATRLEMLGAPMTDWQHPLTREPMRWLRRGAVDTLAFKSGVRLPAGSEESEAEIVWRLPGN